jgi:hypothetical protein
MTKGNKRLHHESQKGYKERLRMEKKIIKGWLRGRRIWNPLTQGTYVRAEQIALGRNPL